MCINLVFAIGSVGSGEIVATIERDNDKLYNYYTTRAEKFERGVSRAALKCRKGGR